MLQLLLAWTAGGALAIGTLWAVLMLGGINLLAQLYTYYTAQLPSTAQINRTGGTMARSARRKSGMPFNVRSSGGKAGTAAGLKMASPTM